MELKELIAPSAQIDGPAEDGSVRIEYGAAKPTVRDYRARVVFGELSDGTAVTLLDAHMQLGISPFGEPRQRFEGHCIVHGAHMDTATEPVHGVRWQVALDSAAWASDEPVKTNLGALASWGGQQHPGLTLRFANPTPLSVAVDEVAPRASSLLSVAHGSRIAILQRQFLTANGTWCPYGLDKPTESTPLHDLLAGSDINLAVIALWIEPAARLEHIPHVAAAGPGIVLELHVFAVLAALEGLHRRLHPLGSQLPGASRGALKRAAKAAAAAAADSLEADGLLANSADDETVMSYERVHHTYRLSLGHVQDPTYADRLRELLNPVTALTPDLFQPGFDQWLDTVRSLRNNEGHALVGPNQFSDKETRHYVGTRISAQWALRLRLLQLVLPPHVLTAALNASTRFDMALANTADLLGN